MAFFGDPSHAATPVYILQKSTFFLSKYARVGNIQTRALFNISHSVDDAITLFNEFGAQRKIIFKFNQFEAWLCREIGNCWLAAKLI